jgi:Fe(3+) dicitrate transport protein
MPRSAIRLACLLLAAWPATLLHAQIPGFGAVQGRITGPEGPVAAASVRLLGADRHAATDQDGRYRLDDVPPGSYTLEASASSFVTARRPILVRAGVVDTVDVTLALRVERLGELEVTAPRAAPAAVAAMPDVADGVLLVGKKTTVLTLDSLDVNSTLNVTRQVLGRVPGLAVSETGGQGFPSNGIGFRGLNPTQSTEVNVRQDGINIAADPYGYPEVYFTPPAEALDRVELVRGASALAYGSQFGGMVNYVIRDGQTGRSPTMRARLTGGSYGAVDGFGDLSGGLGPFTYYSFVQFQRQEGWRPNGDSRQLTGFGRLRWQASDRLRMSLEYTLFRNRIHMPGGLTNEAFNADPQASFRSRNWLGSPWNLISLAADYAIAPSLNLRTTLWGNFSQRYLVWRNEDGGAGAPDVVDPATNDFVAREVEREVFTNGTLESRLTYGYSLLGRPATLATGVRVFQGRMHRQEGGPGSTGSDFNLTLYGGDYENDIVFKNFNLAVYAEQTIPVGSRVTLTPGLRVEYLRSTAAGHTDTLFAPVPRSRTFPLPGVTLEVRTSPTTAIYGDATRAYHPVDYSSITPFASVSRVDPNIHDAKGLSADLGWRGRLADGVVFDVGGFWIRYADRLGLVSRVDSNGTPFTIRTNVATSVQRGIEAYVELQPFRLLGVRGLVGLSVFDAFAFTDAEYVSGPFAGNDVEYAPRYINRLGVTYAHKAVSGTVQVSHVGRQFGDANNTTASTDPNVGVVPAYHVIDLSARVRLNAKYQISGGINNLTDARYFTRRTDEYPGPGIIPSAGRSLYLSAGATF